jgi:hypothetical protein
VTATGSTEYVAIRKPAQPILLLMMLMDINSVEDPNAAELRHINEWIVNEGGATGGWDDRDHQHFLKLRTQIPVCFMSSSIT